ncbi:MAG: hypothetical protein WBD95_25785 [Xanthobacteraceae bacterium]
MARNVGSVFLIAAAFLVCIGTQVSAQGRRYSLAPIAPFPCGAVSLQGNNITFRETIVFVCNCKEQLEMPAGSIMGINAICDGTTLILHYDFGQRNSLFDILHRRCGRSRPRM